MAWGAKQLERRAAEEVKRYLVVTRILTLATELLRLVEERANDVCSGPFETDEIVATEVDLPPKHPSPRDRRFGPLSLARKASLPIFDSLHPHPSAGFWPLVVGLSPR